tara:strand:+ start:244 stop:399 length:156 start_codon:yes stop_codon:yes gene_type:complete
MILRELHLVINIAKLDRKAATAPWELLLRKVKLMGTNPSRKAKTKAKKRAK